MRIDHEKMTAMPDKQRWLACMAMAMVNAIGDYENREMFATEEQEDLLIRAMVALDDEGFIFNTRNSQRLARSYRPGEPIEGLYQYRAFPIVKHVFTEIFKQSQVN